MNLVGLDINEVTKVEHLQPQLRFIAGMGPIKSNYLLSELQKNKTEVLNRNFLCTMVGGETVLKNCAPFLKVQSVYHKNLFEKFEKEKKGHAIQ